MDKDELLEQIIKLEHSIKETQNKWTEISGIVKELKQDSDEKYKAYELIKEQLDLLYDAYKATRNNYQDSQDALRQIERLGKSQKSELEQLKRELARAEDAEKIHQQYLEQVEAFRNKCLEAPWRKENRDDGFGAYEHQIEGAIHLAVARQALLGDKRGLGKSLTGLIYADFLDARKVVVVAPPDTMDNFIREIQMWVPHRSVIKIGKMAKGARDFLLPQLRNMPEFTLVFNYEAWRKDPIFIQDIIALNCDTLLYDEAHKAKTLSTLTCQGIMDIRFGLNECPSCDSPDLILEGGVDRVTCRSCAYNGFITEFCSIKNVLPMTGTPILNKPPELFPHLRMIMPDLFKDEKDFLRDFCRKSYNGKWVWQHGAEAELMEKIGPRYLARNRQSAGIIIPPATPIEHLITQDEFKEGYPKQWKAYQDVRDYAELVLDPDSEVVMSMAYKIVVLVRLRQVLTWPAAIELKGIDPVTEEEYIIAKLDVHESVKLDKAQELISEITEEGERVLSFSMFVDPLVELQRRLGNRAVCYTGDTSDYRKNKIQLDFDPKTAPAKSVWDILLGTYGSMGEGLNLNSATHEILIDRAWNPAKEDQAEGRIDRIGTTRDTYVHRIMVEGTVDTWMKNLIDSKADLIGGFESQADLMQEVYRAIKEGEM